MGIADSRENQWFHEHERQLLQEAKSEREKRLEAYRREHEKAERDRLREAHWMKCPKCGNNMIEEQFEGIGIERCTVCSGVFFDHSELQTLLMRRQENRFKFYRSIFGLENG